MTLQDFSLLKHSVRTPANHLLGYVELAFEAAILSDDREAAIILQELAAAAKSISTLLESKIKVLQNSSLNPAFSVPSDGSWLTAIDAAISLIDEALLKSSIKRYESDIRKALHAAQSLRAFEARLTCVRDHTLASQNSG